MRQKALTVLLINALDAIHLEHVDPDPVNHGPRAIGSPPYALAARINPFISRTALARPSVMERAPIAWPMLSSPISGLAASGTRRIGIGARMQFDHRSACAMRRFDLLRIRVDEQGDSDAGLPQRLHGVADPRALSQHVQAAFGGDFLARF